MTENQKRLAIVGVVIIVALILFMRNSGSNATTVISGNELPSASNLQSPTIVIKERQPFVLPNFSGGASNNSLSAIGACCADCRPQTSSFRNAPSGNGITFVTNRGNSGPNVYNYYQQPVTLPRSTVSMIMRG